MEPGEGSARAIVNQVDQDEDRIVVACTAPSPGNRFGKKIRVTAPDFLVRLRDWLSTRQGRPFPPLLEQLRAIPPKLVELEALALPQENWTGLRSAQQEAVRRTGKGIVDLWGPPGTGKTYTLARAVQSLVARGFKVALLAPTNVAVDTAVLALHACYRQAGIPLSGGFIVRAGFPELDELNHYPELLAWQETLASQQRTLQRLTLSKRETESKLLTAEGKERLVLQTKKAEVNKEIEDCRRLRGEELWTLARKATVLATTVYSGLHREEMQAFFSTPKVALIFDEAAMVPRYTIYPFMEFLSGGEAPQGSLRETPSEVTVILSGDPRQLGPIHSQRREQDVNMRFWLGESLMEELLQPTGEPTAAFLEEQSRMDQSICRRISSTYYSDRLKTVPDSGRPTPPLAPGWPTDGVVIVDAKKAALPSDSPAEESLRYTAKRHERTLQVAVRLIREALANGTRSVLWLTPFRDQAALARKLVDLHFSAHNVRAGTVHTSQGGEADLVIFDPVNVGHRWLQGLIGGAIDIERLLNVSVSRGRGQVIVFTNRKELRKNDLFRRLLHDAAEWDGGGYR